MPSSPFYIYTIGIVVIALIFATSCEAVLYGFDTEPVNINPIVRYLNTRDVSGRNPMYFSPATKSRNCFFSPIQCRLPVEASIEQPFVAEKDVVEKRPHPYPMLRRYRLT